TGTEQEGGDSQEHQQETAIQIVIGILILCLSASVLQVHEVHFTGDVALFLIVVVQVTVSGSVLVHSGRRPTLFWVSLCHA
uniref:Si:dkey-81h8.1 n=1 Tax=Pundamilia nyererei TaxID=303518 RepID=A0A3B4GV49_9CICH